MHASKYVSVFTSGKKQQLLPSTRSVQRPQGRRWQTNLPFSILKRNCQNKRYRIFKSQNPNDLSQPHSPPHLPSLPSCFLRESRARRCLLKSILYLQWGFGIKQAETGWLNAGDAIIRLNLEYTSLQFVW